jgi:hypothetical protein
MAMRRDWDMNGEHCFSKVSRSQQEKAGIPPL